MGQSALPQEVALHLTCHPKVFLFDNTAPDVQMVSDRARQETHFFPVASAGAGGMSSKAVTGE